MSRMTVSAASICILSTVVLALAPAALGAPPKGATPQSKAPPKPKAPPKTKATVIDPGEMKSALDVRIVTKKGSRFTGLIPGDSELAEIIGSNEKFAGSEIPATVDIRLQHVNGLTGSMGLKPSEIEEIEVLGKLDQSKLGEVANKTRVLRDQKWESERARLAKVNEGRAERSRAELEAKLAAEAEAAVIPKLAPELQEWLDLYPPTEGFVPALKEQIYHQTVILNNRAPTERERAWIADYDSWKVAYDAWLDIENQKVAAEEKAKAEGLPAPTGDDRSDPSQTAGSEAANIDPDNPSAADAAILPPKLKPGVKKPVAIDEGLKKPSDLKAGVDKPTKLKNGTDPQ